MTTTANEPVPDSSRRDFLKATFAAGVTAVGFPAIVPSTVLGAGAPSNRIQVAQIGCGRIARESEIPGMLRNSALARFVAVCDLDAVRMADAKAMIESAWAAKGIRAKVKTCGDYREMLRDPAIDAVCISTPDHWHAQPAIDAALAGKAIYLQKPASLTIAEGRQMADAVRRAGAVFQQGSQQRSSAHFRRAGLVSLQAVIGRVKDIYIGLPTDPPGADEPEMPVPTTLNYDMWLGSTPRVYYTEKRIHPQSADLAVRYGRPGWLRCEQFGAGMITGWGAHHIDIAHWGMDAELTGPVEVTATAEFPKRGLWDVHGAFEVEARYANGVVMHLSDKLPNGVRFVGEDGWIFVSRGAVKATASDPTAGQPILKALDASDPKILAYVLNRNDVRLHVSPKGDHHLDWLMA
ncbi:MAG: Gfo/Idh/MocA family oxidoreductase, partial [bacterium]|nr:Gfo/Idh/MocA family oxidoreductase [bacterium]